MTVPLAEVQIPANSVIITPLEKGYVVSFGVTRFASGTLGELLEDVAGVLSRAQEMVASPVEPEMVQQPSEPTVSVPDTVLEIPKANGRTTRVRFGRDSDSTPEAPGKEVDEDYEGPTGEALQAQLLNVRTINGWMIQTRDHKGMPFGRNEWEKAIKRAAPNIPMIQAEVMLNDDITAMREAMLNEEE